MEKVGTQYFMPSYWHHTIAIPIVAANASLKPPFMRREFEIAGSKVKYGSFPKQWQTLVSESHTLDDHLISDIFENEQTIKDVITLEIGRQRRGWINFLGSVAKKVMGVATEDDIKTLAKHIQQLGSMVKSHDHNRKVVLENMHSYEVATNRRLETMHKQVHGLETLTTGLIAVSDEIMTFFKGNHSIQIQLQTLREQVTANGQLAKIIHAHNVRFETLQAIKHSTSSLLSDLNLLAEGKLSPSLVKPSLLKSILKSVKDNVNKISPTFSIASSVKDYYSHRNWVTTTFDKSHLFIKLKIRVSSSDNKFKVFKINSYPMPLGKSEAKVNTRLSGFRKYFGISQSRKQYLELDHFNPVRDLQVIPKSFDDLSCACNIYKGNDRKILSQCTKIIEKRSNNNFQEVIHRLENNDFVIISNENWKIICNDSKDSVNIKHRSMFRMKLKCGCHLTNGDIKLFPDLSSCYLSDNYVAYSSSAFAYYGLYQHLVNINLTVSNFHVVPFEFEVPDFHKIVQNLTKLETLDQSEAYEVHDLEDVLNKSLSHQEESDNVFIDWWVDYASFITPPAISVGLLIDVCEFILIGFMFFKLNTLEHRVALGFSLLPLTEAVNFTLPVTTTTSSVSDLDMANDLWKSVLLVLSLVLASYSIIQQWVDRCSGSESWLCHNPVVLEKLQCDIYVCLYGDNEFAHVKVETVPCRLEDLVIHKAEGLNRIELRHKLCGPSIAVDWSLTKLGIQDAGRIHLPTYTRIPLSAFCKLRRLVRSYHTVIVVGISGDDHRTVSTTEVTPTRPFWRYPMPTARGSNRSVKSNSPNDNQNNQNTGVKLVVTGPTRQFQPDEINYDDNDSDIV